MKQWKCDNYITTIYSAGYGFAPCWSKPTCYGLKVHRSVSIKVSNTALPVPPWIEFTRYSVQYLQYSVSRKVNHTLCLLHCTLYSILLYEQRNLPPLLFAWLCPCTKLFPPGSAPVGYAPELEPSPPSPQPAPLSCSCLPISCLSGWIWFDAFCLIVYCSPPLGGRRGGRGMMFTPHFWWKFCNSHAHDLLV